jgi:hypothetical protein
VFSKTFQAAGRMPERIGSSYHFILSSTARLTPAFGAFSIYLPLLSVRNCSPGPFRPYFPCPWCFYIILDLPHLLPFLSHSLAIDDNTFSGAIYILSISQRHNLVHIYSDVSGPIHTLVYITFAFTLASSSSFVSPVTLICYTLFKWGYLKGTVSNNHFHIWDFNKDHSYYLI